LQEVLRYLTSTLKSGLITSLNRTRPMDRMVELWASQIESNVIKRLMPVHHDHFDAILDLLVIHCIRTIN
jgi:hypothetical protein